MTKKNRVIVSLSDENYNFLLELIGVTLNLEGYSYTLDSKSKVFEVLLTEVRRRLGNI